MDSRDAEQVARARLACVSAGRPPLSAPRRALRDEDAAPVGAPGVVSPEPRRDGATVLPVPRRLTRQHLLVVAVLLLCAVGVAVAALTRSEATEVPVEPTSAGSVQAATPTPSPTPMVRVHVAGEVEQPGVVTLPEGAIVLDAIAAAGGLADTADPADLNLAAEVRDGTQILIGTRDDPRGDLVGSPPGDAAAVGPLDLNEVTAGQLEELPGIGPVTAQSIIAWREENGPFTAVDELQEVSGIGPATLEKLRPLVTV